MAEQFRDYIIRRTVDSKDWEGKSLLDLPPYKPILGVVEITEREMGIVLQLAEAAKDIHICQSGLSHCGIHILKTKDFLSMLSDSSHSDCKRVPTQCR